MDLLYRILFRDKYLSRLVYEKIKEIHDGMYIRKYEDIVDIEWMLDHKHYGILKEKLKNNNSKLFFNFNAKSKRKLFYVPDIEIFGLFIKRFKDDIKPVDIAEVIFTNNYEKIKCMADNGYAYFENLYSFETPYTVDPRILECLIQHGWMRIDVDAPYHYLFRYTQESADVFRRHIKTQTISKAKSIKLLDWILNKSTQHMFTLFYPLFEKPLVFLPPTLESFQQILKPEIRDPHLFEYLCKECKLDETQIKELFIRNVGNDGNTDTLDIVENMIDGFNNQDIKNMIEKCFQRNSFIWLKSILNKYPDFSLKYINVFGSFTNPSDHSFYNDIELLELLLDRGMVLNESWSYNSIKYSSDNCNGFKYLWNRFSSDIQVNKNQILYNNIDITRQIVKICCIQSNHTILLFMMDQGLKELVENEISSQEYWILTNFSHKNNEKVIKTLMKLFTFKIKDYKAIVLNYGFTISTNLFKLLFPHIVHSISKSDIDLLYSKAFANCQLNKIKYLDSLGYQNSQSVLNLIPKLSSLPVEWAQYVYDRKLNLSYFHLLEKAVEANNYLLVKFLLTMYKYKNHTISTNQMPPHLKELFDK
ncbi:hypothetical protein CYY_008890 [Polysphondylium violaceum]|uniref:Ankyrin repeat protein n=1 Tax=Polysphondylium violaceum TaxID=133409 RepID=A0A8J4UWK5_9MYCE|nr:hypothetical protein CYY_008890 [Polysphondylium violaceum]